MIDILELASRNLKRAHEIIADTRIEEIWQSVGAEVNQVGSVKMGLLMKHRDIDFHIYSSPLNIAGSFAAMAMLAENPAIKRIEYTNLIATEEKCVEWHAWYQDADNELWQIDMIHILKGSAFDGFAEHITNEVIKLLTPETKQAILQLKYDTPDDEKIFGVEYYKAVIQYGVLTYADFMAWRKNNPVKGVMFWE